MRRKQGGQQRVIMTIMNDRNQKLSQKLDLSMILGQSRDDDRLMLEDQVLLAALDGSRPLDPDQRNVLQGSPITLLRFRHLALQARARKNGNAANDGNWQQSGGMLRAADSGAVIVSLRTDDHYWTLDFVPDDDGWQFVLSLDVNAPFAGQLLETESWVRVVDGKQQLLLEGQLDADGECEVRWPVPHEPTRHLQQAGAMFRVELVRRRDS
jgi:hypothetical protein